MKIAMKILMKILSRRKTLGALRTPRNGRLLFAL